MSHGFESRFSQRFHRDLPPPLPRQVTNFVYPSAKLGQEGLVLEAASCRKQGLGGIQGASALLQFASNIIPIMTGFAVSSRTSTTTTRSFGSLQGSPRLDSFVPSSAGLSVPASSLISRESQLDKKQSRKSKAKTAKVKEDKCTESVMSVGDGEDTESMISTRWVSGGQDTDKPTGKVNHTRPMQCKQTLKAKKEQNYKRIREKSFDVDNDVSVKVRTGRGHVEEFPGWGNRTALPAEIYISDNEEHVYEDADVLINDNADMEICSQISAQIQLKEAIQKHVSCMPERPHKAGTVFLQGDIKAGAEKIEMQPKRKVAPQKPPRRSNHDAQQDVQVITPGDSMIDDCEQNYSRNLCRQSDKTQSTSSFSTKNTEKIEKYYFGEVLKTSCKQRASSFSPPRGQEMLSNPSHEGLRRRNSRSHSPCMRFKKEEVRESNRPSTQSRNINITLMPKPLFKMSLKTPLGNLKVTGGGGGRSCCCSSKHKCSGCSRSHQGVRRSSSSSPTTVNKRVSSSSRTRRRRKSLSPTPQNNQSHTVSHCVLDRSQRSLDYQGSLRCKGDVEVANLHPGKAFSIKAHYYDIPDSGDSCFKDN